MDVNTARYLAGKWSIVREAFEPTTRLTSGDNASLEQVASLSLFSGHRELWDFYVSAVGYASLNDDVSMPQIIEDLRDDLTTHRTTGFRSFAADVSSLPVEDIVTAARLASRIITPEASTDHIVLSQLKYCLEVCNGNPDPSCLRDCLLGMAS